MRLRSYLARANARRRGLGWRCGSRLRHESKAPEYSWLSEFRSPEITGLLDGPGAHRRCGNLTVRSCRVRRDLAFSRLSLASRRAEWFRWWLAVLWPGRNSQAGDLNPLIPARLLLSRVCRLLL